MGVADGVAVSAVSKVPGGALARNENGYVLTLADGQTLAADVVILADGVNSTLARKAGFHGSLLSLRLSARA